MKKGKSNLHWKERVIREKMAHRNEDVLRKSINLKQLFPHIISSPTMRRFERELASSLI